MRSARKLIFMAICAVSGLFSNVVLAQNEWGVFNSLGASVGVGLTGVDVEVATPITPYLALRGGVSIMPGFSMGTDVDVELDGQAAGSMNVDGSMKRVSGQVLLNIYPFRSSSFFAAVGGYFGGTSLVTIEGTSDQALKDKIAEAESAGIVIGDQMIPFDENGNIYINGELLEENYGAETIQNPGRAAKPITLGDDEYFVMGDNRNNSKDSRSEEVGNVKRSQIIGRAWLRIWPLNKFGLLKHQ